MDTNTKSISLARGVVCMTAVLTLALPWRTLAAVRATGGTTFTTYLDGDGVAWKAHVFTQVGTNDFVVTQGGQVEYLIVGGGGAGGGNSQFSLPRGGGGGAGGMITNVQWISARTYKIVVGDGGDGVESDITGQSVYYAGGGGGGGRNAANGSGGLGGGANAGSHAPANRGGGGGGMIANRSVGNGGSGIVVIRYRFVPRGTLITIR